MAERRAATLMTPFSVPSKSSNTKRSALSGDRESSESISVLLFHGYECTRQPKPCQGSKQPLSLSQVWMAPSGPFLASASAIELVDLPMNVPISTTRSTWKCLHRAYRQTPAATLIDPVS